MPRLSQSALLRPLFTNKTDLQALERWYGTRLALDDASYSDAFRILASTVEEVAPPKMVALMKTAIELVREEALEGDVATASQMIDGLVSALSVWMQTGIGEVAPKHLPLRVSIVLVFDCVCIWMNVRVSAYCATYSCVYGYVLGEKQRKSGHCGICCSQRSHRCETN